MSDQKRSYFTCRPVRGDSRSTFQCFKRRWSISIAVTSLEFTRYNQTLYQTSRCRLVFRQFYRFLLARLSLPVSRLLSQLSALLLPSRSGALPLPSLHDVSAANLYTTIFIVTYSINGRAIKYFIASFTSHCSALLRRSK